MRTKCGLSQNNLNSIELKKVGFFLNQINIETVTNYSSFLRELLSFVMKESCTAKKISTGSLISWNGRAPILTSKEIPLDLQKYEYSSRFSDDFHVDSVKALNDAKQKYPELENSYSLGPYLFYAPDITPLDLTNFIFSSIQQSRSLLFYFFSSITLDYMSILDACRFLLSRIAFPHNIEQINIIFESFVAAYSLANPYISIPTDQMIHIAKSAVLLSGYCCKSSKMAIEEFLSTLQIVKLPEASKRKMYDSINDSPIPLFFTFTHFDEDPDYNKSGLLKKVGGFFHTKKERFFIIEKYVLKYFNDKTKKSQIGELDIEGTISECLPGDKKDAERLLIKNIDGSNIGYKIKKGSRKKSNHKEYIAYGNDSKELEGWIHTLNLVAFWKTFYNITVKN